ncbi:hypothetical protein HYU23_03735 [Candidatus Woesearchaeota archaeon]|nr:hypothetical protein [Candidatus Woesearchaeota archaeon]
MVKTTREITDPNITFNDVLGVLYNDGKNDVDVLIAHLSSGALVSQLPIETARDLRGNVGILHIEDLKPIGYRVDSHDLVLLVNGCIGLTPVSGSAIKYSKKFSLLLERESFKDINAPMCEKKFDLDALVRNYVDVSYSGGKDVVVGLADGRNLIKILSHRGADITQGDELENLVFDKIQILAGDSVEYKLSGILHYKSGDGSENKEVKFYDLRLTGGEIFLDRDHLVSKKLLTTYDKVSRSSGKRVLAVAGIAAVSIFGGALILNDDRYQETKTESPQTVDTTNVQVDHTNEARDNEKLEPKKNEVEQVTFPENIGSECLHLPYSQSRILLYKDLGVDLQKDSVYRCDMRYGDFPGRVATRFNKASDGAYRVNAKDVFVKGLVGEGDNERNGYVHDENPRYPGNPRDRFFFIRVKTSKKN